MSEKIEKIVVLQGEAKKVFETAASFRVNGGTTETVRNKKERDALRTHNFR